MDNEALAALMAWRDRLAAFRDSDETNRMLDESKVIQNIRAERLRRMLIRKTPQLPLSPPRKAPFKAFVDFQGIPIDIERVQGDIKSGRDKDGNFWKNTTICPYGEVQRTKATLGGKGVDGDRLDVYVGPDATSPYAVVIDQLVPDTGAFDEQKLILGFDEASALEFYDAQYAPSFRGGHRVMSIPSLKRWLAEGSNAGRILKALTRIRDALTKAHPLSEAEHQQRVDAGRASGQARMHYTESPAYKDAVTAWGGATKDTAPFTHWRAGMSSIVNARLGGTASEDEIDRALTRERIQRWYNAGETAEMAAMSAASVLNYARPQIKHDQSAAAMRRIIALGAKQGRNE